MYLYGNTHKLNQGEKQNDNQNKLHRKNQNSKPKRKHLHPNTTPLLQTHPTQQTTRKRNNSHGRRQTRKIPMDTKGGKTMKNKNLLINILLIYFLGCWILLDLLTDFNPTIPEMGIFVLLFVELIKTRE